MTLTDLIFKFFGINLIKTPNGILKKFLKESDNKFVIFEMYYKNKLIIQLENEKYMDDNIVKKIKEGDKLKLGYILSFALPFKGIESNKIYKNYRSVSNNLNMIEFHHQKLNLMSFNKRFEHMTSLYEIGNCIKKVVMSVYRFKEDNPKIVYNLRYPNTGKG